MTKRLDVSVECVIDEGNTTGESPVWSAREQALYWVDIPAGNIFRWQPATGARRQWHVPSFVGSIGLRERGGLVLALRSGFHVLDLETEKVTLLCRPDPDVPGTRLNDGKVSPDGRFWAGTMDEAKKDAIANLYRLDADHRCTRMAGDVKISNGLAWSPDGRTMYHSDSRGGAIFRYDHDPATGAIGPRQVFVTMQPEWGRPDGGATDEEGFYWSCGVSAGRVNRFSPDGKLVSYVQMPITHPTMPCFGGPRGRTVYVTSLREGFTEAEIAATPQAGGVFTFEADVAGAPAAFYKG